MSEAAVRRAEADAPGPPTRPAPVQLPSTGEENERWIQRLRGPGPEREQALAELHALLLRAAGFELGRRRAALGGLLPGDREDLAHQCADDALVAILRKLGEFRGESRFTTWAYKFALYEAAVKVRRLAWRHREVPLDAPDWPPLADRGESVHAAAEMRETLTAVKAAIDSELTPHQREVLVAIAINGVPIDVLAERLNTTRGALYKTLHDGRRKLRGALSAQGLPRTEDGGDG
jgi:RNA polymerase sigma-70 factor (ECF subfamily)